ncbi:MAG: bifunctional precorrin-2 dehydrogenase/sirohydrochlorin ferrochelatase [Armatimonadota bacterium]
MPAEPADEPRPFFPAFIDLRGKLCLVVGGGEVAARKARSLLAAGARLRVVAPELSQQMSALAANCEVTCAPRHYAEGDLDGTLLVFAATDDADVNAAVYRDATARGLLVNVVDDPAHCTFIVPSQVVRDGIRIAISTQGQSPALAKRLREKIEAAIPPAYGKLAALMGRLRAEVRKSVPSLGERSERWQAVLDSDVLSLIEQQRLAEAEALARNILGLPADAGAAPRR